MYVRTYKNPKQCNKLVIGLCKWHDCFFFASLHRVPVRFYGGNHIITEPARIEDEHFLSDEDC